MSGTLICVDDILELMNSMGIRVAKNILSGKIVVSGMPEEFSKEDSVNTLPLYLREVFKKKADVKVSRSDIEDALLLIADLNRFHPVEKFFKGDDGCIGDGFDRVEFLINNILRIDENDTFSAMLVRKWLHQTVAITLNDEENPYGADGILTLKGPQGVGKSLFFKKIAVYPELFAEGISINLDVKDSIIQSSAVWIAELGELDSTLNRKQAQFKAFITNSRDVYRPPYGRYTVERPRRTSFCATVNPDGFLKDDTGSRRFWVVPVDRIDVELMLSLDEEWFISMWRQVYQEYYLDDPQGFRLTHAERQELDARNRQYYADLPGEDEVVSKLDFDSDDWVWYNSTEVKDLLKLSKDPSQIGKVLTNLSKYDSRIQTKSHHNKKLYYLPRIAA